MIIESIRSITSRKRSGVLEIANGICFLLAILCSILAKYHGAVWLLCIIGLADLARFILCGYWYHIPFREDVHYHCPQKDQCYRIGIVAKLSLYFVLFVSSFFTTTIGYCAWYFILAISVFEALRTLAHVSHKRDRSWLEDNEGRIGILGISGIICIILTSINCHLIATECLGKNGMVIACILTATYVVVLNLVNNLIWQNDYERVTRYYAWLESFSRKFFIISHAIAITVAYSKTGITLNNVSIATVLLIAVIFTIIRDLWMAFWHITGRWSIRYISSRSGIMSAVRDVLTCLWVIFSIVAISINNQQLADYTAVGAFCIAGFSIIYLVSEVYDTENARYYTYDEGPY